MGNHILLQSIHSGQAKAQNVNLAYVDKMRELNAWELCT